MSEVTQRTSVRFCPGCGERTAAGANYCPGCGIALRGPASSGPASAAPASPTAGLVVLASFLAAGLALWVTILLPEEEPGRRPLASRPTAPAEGSGAEGRDVPPGHPPVEIPEEVRRFITELEAEAKAKPDDLTTWKNLAQVQYRAGQVDSSYLADAEKSFLHVLELDSRDLEALRGLANIHFDRDEYDAAVKRYSEYLEIRPDAADVRTDRATMLLHGGKIDEAIAEYRRVIEKSPDFYQAYFNLGIASARKNRPDEARAALAEARRLAPDDAVRGQVDRVLAQFGGGAPSGSSFHDRVEANLRRHQIVGPKVVSFEWSSETEGRVVLDQFPMEQMPEFVREKFLGRLERELGEARAASGASGVARLELVDRASGDVMATIAVE